jgi:hypothetical protein
MSQQQQILLIMPTALASLEKFTYRGYECNHCAGRGYYDHSGWMEKFKQNPDDPDWTSCKICNGTGRLIAEVTVKWVACFDSARQPEEIR